MKVRELIEVLQALPQDAKLVVYNAAWDCYNQADVAKSIDLYYDTVSRAYYRTMEGDDEVISAVAVGTGAEII